MGDGKIERTNYNKFKLKQIVLFLGLIFIGSIILSGAVSAAGLATSPHPKFNHDNNNSGQSQYKGPQTNTTKWKFPANGGALSSPAIGADGTIYYGSFDNKFYALNPNGTEKWSFNCKNVLGVSPAIDDNGIIYLCSNSRIFYALYPNGTEKWTFTLDNANLITTSQAIADDGTIYFATASSVWNYHNNSLCALTPDGTLKWNFHIEGISLSNPAIGNDGTIYLGDNNNYLYAINPNGTEKWNFTSNNMIVSSPAIGSDGTIYFGCEDNDVYALNPNGTLKWKYQTGNVIDSSPAIANDGTIYIISYDGFLYALTVDGNLKWKYSIYNSGISTFISSPAIGSDGIVYIGSENGLYAINPNGTLKWRYQTGNHVESSPAIGTDGTLYFGSDDKNFYAIQDLNADANHKGGIYNSTQTVALRMNQPGTIYYTTNGTNPTTSSPVYSKPLNISKSTILKYLVSNLSGDLSPIYRENYIIDKIAPTAKSNLSSGLYNSTKIVNISMTENGIIYYTLNGTNPTTASTNYTGTLTISSTKILKYLAIDLAGNKSPIYTQTYTIDKVAPKVSSTSPKNNAIGVSLTAPITIKFSKNIVSGANYSKIYIKNMTTGLIVGITQNISGNTLIIKMTKSRLHGNTYQVTIPKAAIKDYAGNNLAATYIFKFKTGST